MRGAERGGGREGVCRVFIDVSKFPKRGEGEGGFVSVCLCVVVVVDASRLLSTRPPPSTYRLSSRWGLGSVDRREGEGGCVC
jgi:hypothetical protein